MAHLWTLDPAGATATILSRHTFALVDGALDSVATAVTHTQTRTPLLLHRLNGEPDSWALVSAGPDDVRLNGGAVPLGLAVLNDRDEIRVRGRLHVFFSTEELPHIEAYSGSRGRCPRCKQEIAAGSLAVRCPQCGLWHHQSDELRCWDYAATCAACTQETSLDAGFRWTPEEL